MNAATGSWGVKILRYEIRDLTPPSSIMEAMERQVKAEREKRAVILQSEGEKQSAINIAEGQRASAIALSEGDKMAQINRAEGEAQQILRIAQATAEGLQKIKDQLDGDAVAAAQLRLAEAYIAEFGKLAEKNNTMIIPADAASVGSMIGLVTGMLKPGQGLNKTQG